MTIKKILVPTDFSDCATSALRYAVGLGLREPTTITLLHVYQIPTYFFADGSIVGAGAELVTKLMDWIETALLVAKREAESLGAAEVHVTSAPGTPHQEIVRVAAEGEHDLIVMGTHGHTGVKHLLLGSTAERVVRYARRPVLTVPLPSR